MVVIYLRRSFWFLEELSTTVLSTTAGLFIATVLIVVKNYHTTTRPGSVFLTKPTKIVGRIQTLPLMLLVAQGNGGQQD